MWVLYTKYHRNWRVKGMLSKEIVQRVGELVSGSRAKDFVREVSVFHRIQGSPGILRAMEFLKGEIERTTKADVEIIKYPVGDKEPIGSWDDLYAWTPRSATLELIEPETGLLADFQAEPISLAAFSTSADVEAEVVYVGKGLTDADYDGKDVRGKIVLTESKAAQTHRPACIERGAIGVLTFIPPSGRDEIASIRRYEGLWPRMGEGDKTRFGFSLTQADGLRLKNWIEEGKTVRVRAHVDADLGTGINPVLSAVLPGKDTTKEILLIAHICHPHPGANDNASGSAALLETLRVISRMLEEKTLETLDHNIRFLWVPEWHGTIRYIKETADLSRIKAVINVDMVGGDPAKIGSTLHLIRTPYSCPSTLNNVVRYWLEQEAKREVPRKQGGSIVPSIWDYRTYSAGSDHFMFTDLTLSIPAVMLNQFPDKYYHTSMDTPDQICPKQMAFVSRALILSTVTLAVPSLVTKEILLGEVAREGSELLTRTCVLGVEELGLCEENPEDVYPRVMRWLEYAKELGERTLQKAEEEWSLITVQKAILQAMQGALELEYTSKMMVARKAYEGACVGIGLEAKDEVLPDIGKIGLEVEVKRKLKYALSPTYFTTRAEGGPAKFTKMQEEDHHLLDRVDELLNLCKDWTLLSTIWDRLCFQFGKIDPIVIRNLADDLAALDLIELRDV